MLSIFFPHEYNNFKILNSDIFIIWTFFVFVGSTDFLSGLLFPWMLCNFVFCGLPSIIRRLLFLILHLCVCSWKMSLMIIIASLILIFQLGVVEVKQVDYNLNLWSMNSQRIIIIKKESTHLFFSHLHIQIVRWYLV